MILILTLFSHSYNWYFHLPIPFFLWYCINSFVLLTSNKKWESILFWVMSFILIMGVYPYIHILRSVNSSQCEKSDQNLSSSTNWSLKRIEYKIIFERRMTSNYRLNNNRVNHQLLSEKYENWFVSHVTQF